MASNIDPSISLGGRPPPTMTLPQMLDLARGAQAFQREREILPELVEQARIGTGTARIGQEQAGFTLSKDQNKALMAIVGGYRNDPRIASGNPDAALSAIDEIKVQAVAAGISRSRVEQIGVTATNIAINNPKALAQYFDNVIQSQIEGTGQQALQTPQLTNLGGVVEVFTPATRTLTQPTIGQPTRQSVAPTSQDVASTPQNVAQPPQNVLQSRPNGRVEPLPAGITGKDLTSPIAGADAAGYELRFPPLPSNVRNLRPPMPGEADVAAAGTIYLNDLQKAQGAVPTTMRSVSQVISGAQKVGEKINFETGALADIERNLRVFFTDDIYQQLNKDLANAQIARMRASGGDLSTDAGKSLAAAAGGTATLSPRVLIKIAGELAGELTKIDMESKGAQKAVTLFGPANLPAYQQAWNNNARDTRVFEFSYIIDNVKDAKQQKSALDKILPNTKEELQEFQQRYNNIKKLSETGTLR
jgi:hypothetical protein